MNIKTLGSEKTHGICNRESQGHENRLAYFILYANTDLKAALTMNSKFGFQVIPKTDFQNE
jgi:hypothetical protein